VISPALALLVLKEVGARRTWMNAILVLVSMVVCVWIRLEDLNASVIQDILVHAVKEISTSAWQILVQPMVQPTVSSC